MQDRHEAKAAPMINTLQRGRAFSNEKKENQERFLSEIVNCPLTVTSAIQNSILGASNPSLVSPRSTPINFRKFAFMVKVMQGTRVSDSRTSEKRRLRPTHSPKDPPEDIIAELGR